MKMTAKEITRACGGRLLCGDPDTVVTSVSTDSRKIDSGTLFVPIKGERTDAHTFIDATFAAGASATLTQEHDQMDDKHAWIRVQSTEQALQQIAAVYRRKFSIPFIGITGSVGKTTTKEMVALALSAGRNVMKTEGNFNSQIGLPLTMFTLQKSHQAAVIEMGMSNFGEMSRLAQIAAPDYAVVTNIGISHIEQLKTQQNIMNEKLHITDCFHKDSVLFLNGDDEMLRSAAGKTSFFPSFAIRRNGKRYGLAPSHGAIFGLKTYGRRRRPPGLPWLLRKVRMRCSFPPWACTMLQMRWQVWLLRKRLACRLKKRLPSWRSIVRLPCGSRFTG